ncbi:Enolase-phosphatase E1 [Geranomyces variabilis]|uniref:Enolase-phosphatase E1 n=1 Tax=Geranomyces variabilis TaxID=109894 RepID=A0AAD5XRF9_9FUNG|nr:Enolase-phosphatase E1 [Geranomyces variabilis]
MEPPPTTPPAQQQSQQHGSSLPYRAVVLDIEGTTTPITFVHDVLFPYVSANLVSFLASHWTDPECVAKAAALREQAHKDIEDGVPGVVPVLPPREESVEDSRDDEAVRASVVANVLWQMSIDRKIGPLKALQGYMWRAAYESKEILGDVYPDVLPALTKWTKEHGLPVYIYSSGSVEAQKLLFGWSVNGSMLNLFRGHFDTSIGLKVEANSYRKIVKEIAQKAEDVLFVSDNVREIEAALAAGLRVAVADRPGNAPLPRTSTDATSDHLATIDLGGLPVPVVRSFDEFFVRPEFSQASDASPQRFQLDNLIHLETMFEELGREDGLRDGVQAGRVEGLVAGTEAGFAMGQEAGFYAGAAASWLMASDQGLITLPDRAIKALKAVTTQAAEFPTINNKEGEGADPTVALDRLRGKFKVAQSALGGLAANQRFRPEEATRPVMNF